MAEPDILVEYRDSIAIITINRLHVHNALDKHCWEMLRLYFEQLDANDEVRAVILTGAGSKAFAAGADIKMLLERSVPETITSFNASVTKTIGDMSKPTIAALNGLALGGGCELALACDIRIAAPHVKIGQTELNVGILPAAGGTQWLVRLVGPGKAMEMILTGEPVTAEEALRIGLVNRLAEADELMNEAIKIAEKITSKSPLIVRLAKIAIREGMKADLHSGLMLERMCQSVAFSTKDHTEGLTAFLEKRSPNYEGI